MFEKSAKIHQIWQIKAVAAIEPIENQNRLPENWIRNRQIWRFVWAVALNQIVNTLTSCRWQRVLVRKLFIVIHFRAIVCIWFGFVWFGLAAMDRVPSAHNCFKMFATDPDHPYAASAPWMYFCLSSNRRTTKSQTFKKKLDSKQTLKWNKIK